MLLRLIQGCEAFVASISGLLLAKGKSVGCYLAVVTCIAVAVTVVKYFRAQDGEQEKGRATGLIFLVFAVLLWLLVEVVTMLVCYLFTGIVRPTGLIFKLNEYAGAIGSLIGVVYGVAITVIMSVLLAVLWAIPIVNLFLVVTGITVERLKRCIGLLSGLGLLYALVLGAGSVLKVFTDTTMEQIGSANIRAVMAVLVSGFVFAVAWVLGARLYKCIIKHLSGREIGGGDGGGVQWRVEDGNTVRAMPTNLKE